MTVHRALFGFGSNLMTGGSERITDAIEVLRSFGAFERISSIYMTRPFGSNAGEDDYHNCVASFLTGLDLDELIRLLKQIEKDQGRDRCKKPHFVPIDIDVVIWDNLLLRPGEMEREYFLKGYREIE